MKKFLPAILLISVIYNQASAGGSSYLQLRGTTLKTSKFKVVSQEITPLQTQVLFSTQSNSKYPEESQKFEFEGDADLKQGLKIKKITSDNRTSLYEIIITKRKSSPSENSPLFLKISAN